MEVLRSDNVRFDFQLIEGVPHAEFVARLARADIIIDQVHSDSWGVAALEGLACGKVVVSGNSPKAQNYFPWAHKNPSIDAPSDPKALAATLKATLESRDGWPATAEAGRSYVAEYHDHVSVAEAFIALWSRRTSRLLVLPDRGRPDVESEAVLRPE